MSKKVPVFDWSIKSWIFADPIKLKEVRFKPLIGISRPRFHRFIVRSGKVDQVYFSEASNAN